jgi:hypothetical protein
MAIDDVDTRLGEEAIEWVEEPLVRLYVLPDMVLVNLKEGVRGYTGAVEGEEADVCLTTCCGRWENMEETRRRDEPGVAKRGDGFAVELGKRWGSRKSGKEKYRLLRTNQLWLSWS